MVRFFGTLSSIVSEMGTFDPLGDHTTREYEFVAPIHIAVDQEMIDWFISVYQMHYGHHRHVSRGEDDGRDKPITSLPPGSNFELPRLVTLMTVLDFYHAQLLLDLIEMRICAMIRSHQVTFFPTPTLIPLRRPIWIL